MEDLIRRSDAIAILEDLQSKHLQFCLVPFRIAIEKMEAIPSADIDLSGYSDKLWKNAYERGKADIPQGEWVPFEHGDERWHKCTACGVADRYIEYVERPNGTTGKLVAIRNYCPNCGAKMKGADDE